MVSWVDISINAYSTESLSNVARSLVICGPFPWMRRYLRPANLSKATHHQFQEADFMKMEEKKCFSGYLLPAWLCGSQCCIEAEEVSLDLENAPWSIMKSFLCVIIIPPSDWDSWKRKFPPIIFIQIWQFLGQRDFEKTLWRWPPQPLLMFCHLFQHLQGHRPTGSFRKGVDAIVETWEDSDSEINRFLTLLIRAFPYP